MNVFKRLKGKCTCGSVDWHDCTCRRYKFFSIRYEQRGKMVERVLKGITTEADALSIARSERKLRSDAERDEWFRFMDTRKLRNTCSSLGELLDVVQELGLRVFAPAVLRRNMSSLILVVAYARNLWTTADSGRHGVRRGERCPDAAAVRALPLTVLTRRLVLDYFAARVGGEVEWRKPSRANITVNQTLNFARNLFSTACRTRIFEGRLVLPDVSGFTGSGYLPVVRPGPAPLRAEEFDAMCAAADALSAVGDAQHVATVNLLLRQSGMRVGSLLTLHDSWLQMFKSGSVCEVRDVKGGTLPYAIPVGAGFVEAVERWQRVPSEERKAALAAHNDWLGQFMPGDGVSHQRAHRLRDTAGTVAKVLYGLAAAVELLGHASGRTTIRHYAKLQWDISERMRAELGAASRLVPTNVLPLPAAPVAA